MNKPVRAIGNHDPESTAPTPGKVYVGLSWTGDIICENSNQLTCANLAVLEAVKALAGAFAAQSMSGVKQASEALCDAAKAAGAAAKSIEVSAAMLSRKSAEHLNRRARV